VEEEKFFEEEQIEFVDLSITDASEVFEYEKRKDRIKP
jgi:hypothetical protein